MEGLDGGMFEKLIDDVGRNNESFRHQWLTRVLHDLPSGSRILDAGAGTQQYRHLCVGLNYVSQDFGQYDGKGNESGLQTGEFDYKTLDIVSDIANIPEPDKSFDAIMCIEVLEHLPDPVSAIKEFSRLLRSGGHLIITAPFCSLTHYAPYHFSTGFNRYFYENHLPEMGFNIVEIQGNGNYFEYLAQEIRRLNSVAKTYTHRGLTVVDKALFFLVLMKLRYLSAQDSNSNELLCFGYHVHAVKENILRKAPIQAVRDDHRKNLDEAIKHSGRS